MRFLRTLLPLLVMCFDTIRGVDNAVLVEVTLMG